MLPSIVYPFLRRVDPALYHSGPGEGATGLRLRYLGTACFELEAAGRTLVFDPFVSRPGLLGTGLARLLPDEAAVARHLPRADEVLIGHAHHDHILDAPALCRRTGARLVGSRAACMVGRAAGVPEAQLVETAGREDIACGPLTARGIPSLHGRVYFGRVPLAGDIEAPPPWPPRLRDLRHGLVLNWLVRTPGATVVHIDSAEFLDAELDGLQADVLCLCAIGRQSRPGYTAEVVARLRPRWVVPCHWDWFFSPLQSEARALPGVDLAGFLQEIRAAGATPVLLPLLGSFAP